MNRRRILSLILAATALAGVPCEAQASDMGALAIIPLTLLPGIAALLLALLSMIAALVWAGANEKSFRYYASAALVVLTYIAAGLGILGTLYYFAATRSVDLVTWAALAAVSSLAGFWLFWGKLPWQPEPFKCCPRAALAATATAAVLLLFVPGVTGYLFCVGAVALMAFCASCAKHALRTMRDASEVNLLWLKILAGVISAVLLCLVVFRAGIGTYLEALIDRCR